MNFLHDPIPKKWPPLEPMTHPIKRFWGKLTAPSLEGLKQAWKNCRKNSFSWRHCFYACMSVGFIGGIIVGFHLFRASKQRPLTQSLLMPPGGQVTLLTDPSHEIFQDIANHQDHIDEHWDQVNLDFWKICANYWQKNDETFERFKIRISEMIRSELKDVFEKFLRMYGFKERWLQFEPAMVAPEILFYYSRCFKPFYTFGRIYFFDYRFAKDSGDPIVLSKNIVQTSEGVKIGDRKETFHRILGDPFKAVLPSIQSMEAALESQVCPYQTHLNSIHTSFLNAFTHFINVSVEDLKAVFSSFNQIFEVFSNFTHQWPPFYFEVWGNPSLLVASSVKVDSPQNDQRYKALIFELEQSFLVECCSSFFPLPSFSDALNVSQVKISSGALPSTLETFEEGFKTFLDASYRNNHFYPKITAAIEAYINEAFNNACVDHHFQMKEALFKTLAEELNQEEIEQFKSIQRLCMQEEITRANIMEKIKATLLPGQRHRSILLRIESILHQLDEAEFKEKFLIQIESFFSSGQESFPKLIKILEPQFFTHPAICWSMQEGNSDFPLYSDETIDAFERYITLKQKFCYLTPLLNSKKHQDKKTFLKRLDALMIEHLLHQQWIQVHHRCFEFIVQSPLIEDLDRIIAFYWTEELIWIRETLKKLKSDLHTLFEEQGSEITSDLPQKMSERLAEEKSRAKRKFYPQGEYSWSEKMLETLEKEIKKIFNEKELFQIKHQKIDQWMDDMQQTIKEMGVISFWFYESDIRKKEILEWNDTFSWHSHDAFSNWEKEFREKIEQWLARCKKDAEHFLEYGILAQKQDNGVTEKRDLYYKDLSINQIISRKLSS